MTKMDVVAGGDCGEPQGPSGASGVGSSDCWIVGQWKLGPSLPIFCSLQKDQSSGFIGEFSASFNHDV